jgi:hypothetical protein
VTAKLKGFELVAERPLTVTVLLCPAVIDNGSKAQVAPEEQESAMSLTKELGAEAETVKVVEVVPITATLDRVLVEREKIAFPMPVSDTPWGLPAASSLILKVPLRVPLPVGVNVMLAVQLAPTLRTLGRFPQVLVCAKSPLMLIPVRVTAILPLLVTRTTCGGLVVPAGSAGKLRLVGDSNSDPAEVTPFPVAVMLWGLPAALSLMVIWSVRGPVVVGVKVI